MRPDGSSEKTLFFITGLEHQLKQRDKGGERKSRPGGEKSLLYNAKANYRLLVFDLFLFNLGLRVVVDGLLGIRQVLFPILYIFAFKHHAGTAGQDQFLPESNSKSHLALV